MCPRCRRTLPRRSSPIRVAVGISLLVVGSIVAFASEAWGGLGFVLLWPGASLSITTARPVLRWAGAFVVALLIQATAYQMGRAMLP